MFDISIGLHSSLPRIAGVLTVMLLAAPTAVEFTDEERSAATFGTLLRSSGTNAQSSFVHGDGVELYVPSMMEEYIHPVRRFPKTLERVPCDCQYILGEVRQSIIGSKNHTFRVLSIGTLFVPMTWGWKNREERGNRSELHRSCESLEV